MLETSCVVWLFRRCVVVRVMQVQEKMLSTSRESDIMRGLSPRKSRGKVS